MDNKKNVYILDIGAYSGGGEALHQLGVDLINLGYNVYIVAKKENSSVRLPKKFQKYYDHGLKRVNLSQVEDESSNVIIVPEASTETLFRTPKMKKIIYWLSYENYDDGKFHWDQADTIIGRISGGLMRNAKQAIKNMINLMKYHQIRYPIEHAVNISGSNYASLMLDRLGVEHISLFHSIGVDFLNAGLYDDVENREDIVLYNPAKPSRLTKQLLRRGKYHYVPIQSLNFKQMISLFRKAKLYIDFGNFPGPERLPKETVFNGVNQLVWRMHAADTDDVLIPQKYKLSIDTAPDEAESVIGSMLENYVEESVDFDAFREMVNNMDRIYYQQLENICETYL